MRATRLARSVSAARSFSFALRRTTISPLYRRNFSQTSFQFTPRKRTILLPTIVLGFGLGYSYYSSQFFLNSENDKSEESQKAQASESTSPKPESSEQPAQSRKAAAPKERNLQYKYVLIGGGTTTYSALKEIKALDPEGTVLIISREQEPTYQRPPLTKELWNSSEEDASNRQFTNWQGKKDSLYYPRDEKLYYNVTTLYSTNAVDLDVQNKLVLLENKRIVEYDKLLIATGGDPRTLPLELGDAKSDVSTFRTIEDFDRISQLSKQGKRIIIVGGGFLGSELAAALGKQSQATSGKITQLFPEVGCMGLILPPSLSAIATEKVKSVGVDVRPGQLVKSITKDANGVVLTTTDGNTIETDHIVVCIGLKPNNELAKKAEIEIDPKNGGIVVNSELEALRDVFVAGDVSSYYDITLETRRRVEHYEHAWSSGATAGKNMASLSPEPYRHLSMFWSDLPGISYQATGIIDAKLETVSLFAGTKEEKYGRGLIYYFDPNSKKLVGVLLWNIFDRLDDAKALLQEGKKKPNKGESVRDWIPIQQKH